jgi:hypothetical protein
METLKALFKQPSNADMHMHCQVKMVIYAYGIFPIAVDARLIKDDQIKVQVPILGKYIPVWQISNVARHVEYSHAANDNLTNSPAANGNSTYSVPLAAQKQSIRSSYQLENTTYSVQHAYSVFSAVLASSTLLPFPLYISMAPIEIDLKPVTPDTTIDTSYWKLSVAPFLVSLSPFSDSTVSAAVTFTCSSNPVGGGIGMDTNSSCSLYSPLIPIAQILMPQRNSTISTVYGGSNIFLYNLIASITSQETALKIPLSFLSPNFLSNPNLHETLTISSRMSIMGKNYFEDFVTFSYGPKEFGIHVLESMSGIDFNVSGHMNYLGKLWLVFLLFLMYINIFICIYICIYIHLCIHLYT